MAKKGAKKDTKSSIKTVFRSKSARRMQKRITKTFVGTPNVRRLAPWAAHMP
jgi:hypothetical protein